MTQRQSALSELAEALTGTDATLATSIAEIMATALQELIEAELTAKIGAEPGERTLARTNLRNGHRPKLVSREPTRVRVARIAAECEDEAAATGMPFVWDLTEAVNRRMAEEDEAEARREAEGDAVPGGEIGL